METLGSSLPSAACTAALNQGCSLLVTIGPPSVPIEQEAGQRSDCRGLCDDELAWTCDELERMGSGLSRRLLPQNKAWDFDMWPATAPRLCRVAINKYLSPDTYASPVGCLSILVGRCAHRCLSEV